MRPWGRAARSRVRRGGRAEQPGPVGAALSLRPPGGTGPNKPRRPNIVFLMADDLGFGDMGFNGNKVIKTPHLDKMAADGIRFTRFYSIGPICSPTRASCLTGRHYMRFGMMDVNVGKLPTQEVTLAKLAKAAGYTTGHFGKCRAVLTLFVTETETRKCLYRS